MLVRSGSRGKTRSNRYCWRFVGRDVPSGRIEQDSVHGEFHPAQRRDRRRPHRPRRHHPLGLQRPDGRHFRHFRRPLPAHAAARCCGGSSSSSACRSAPALGAAVAPRIFAEMPATLPDDRPRRRSALVVAGLLVGVGTRIGRGCTSGHGICGLARLSPRSFVAVGIFMATAMRHRLRRPGTSSDDPRRRLAPSSPPRLSGIIFGFGLAVARMTDPQKVKDFLDIAAIPPAAGTRASPSSWAAPPWSPSSASGSTACSASRWLARLSAVAAALRIDRAARRRRGDLRHRLGPLRLLPGPGDRRSRPHRRRRVVPVRRRHARRLMARRAPCPASFGSDGRRSPRRQNERTLTTSSSSAPDRSASPRRSECERRGYDVALVAPPRAGHDERTSALLAGSVALLERLGVWDVLAAKARRMRSLRIVDGTRRLIRAPEVTFHASEIGLDAFGYNVRNADLVDALEMRVAARGLRRLATSVAGVAAGRGRDQPSTWRRARRPPHAWSSPPTAVARPSATASASASANGATTRRRWS